MFKLSSKSKKSINRAIKQIGDKDAKKAVRKATRASAKVFAKELKKNAPVDTGELKKSIKVRAAKRSRKYIGVNATVGLDTDAFYGNFIEFGAKGPRGWHKGDLQAKPWIVPSYDNKRKEAERAFLDTMKTETKKFLQ